VKWLLTVLALGVAALPAALVFGFGVHRSGVLPDPLGPDSGALFFLTLFYVIWLPFTAYGLIWVFDRLGYHFAVSERPDRPTRRERRRQTAGLRYLEGQERSRRQAASQSSRARAGKAAATERARRERRDEERRRRGHEAEAEARAAARSRGQGTR
jgi:hypothetical protein